VSKHHYGAILAVILGFVLFRVLSVPIVDVVGTVGGHQRSADMAIGVVIAAIPFLSLVAFTVLALRHSPALGHRWVKGAFVGAWFVAGVVMGILPYSRMGTSTELLDNEVDRAPSFLHGVDLTIIAGLAMTVALLLITLRARHQPASAPIDWIEHQFEDAPEEPRQLDDGR
jgi:hypothetical protein